MWDMIAQIAGIALLILLLTFLGIVFFSEVLLFSYLLIDYNLRSLYKPKEYPPAPLSRFIVNFWKEYIYIMAKFLLLPFKWLDLTINKSSPAETAVLLVHGYCRNQSDWLWMRKQLKELNCPIFTINLQPMLAPIEDIVHDSFPKKIEEIKNTTQCKKLILVGHSMGGLACSYYKEFVDKQDFVKNVITIGTPFYGTKIAIAATGPNARQMCPGNEFLNDLHSKIGHNPTQYYQICTKFDNKIFPWQSALYEHSDTDKHHILTFEAHLLMLRSKEVAQQLNTWLSELI